MERDRPAGRTQLLGIVREDLRRGRRAPAEALVQPREDAARRSDRELLPDDRAHERAVVIGRGSAAVGRVAEHARADALDDRLHHRVRAAQVGGRPPGGPARAT